MQYSQKLGSSLCQEEDKRKKIPTCPTLINGTCVKIDILMRLAGYQLDCLFTISIMNITLHHISTYTNAPSADCSHYVILVITPFNSVCYGR